MENVPDQLTQAIREIVCHEIDVIVSEDNEWFTEQLDNAVSTYVLAAVNTTLKESGWGNKRVENTHFKHMVIWHEANESTQLLIIKADKNTSYKDLQKLADDQISDSHKSDNREEVEWYIDHIINVTKLIEEA